MRTPMVPEEIVWGGRNAEYVNPESKLWRDRMAEKGWTCPTWPQEYGGGGLSKDEAVVLKEELSRINARIALTSFGISMLGPVLLEYGASGGLEELRQSCGMGVAHAHVHVGTGRGG